MKLIKLKTVSLFFDAINEDHVFNKTMMMNKFAQMTLFLIDYLVHIKIKN